MAEEANSWDPSSILGRDTSFDVPESSCLLSGPGLQPDSRYNAAPCHSQKVERKRTSVSQRMQMPCSWRRRSLADLRVRMVQRSSGRPTGTMWMWGFVFFPSLFQLRLQLFRGEMQTVGKSFCSKSKSAYLEVVQWRPNIFAIPLGAAGKKFVEESTRLVQAFAEGSALESVSFWALMLMPSLLLQQPTGQPSHRQRTDCLQRRLLLWATENIGELLLEGRVVQTDLRRRLTRKRYDPSEGISRAFSQLMIQGKVKAALRLSSIQSRGEVLDPDAILPGGDNAEASPKTVLDVLREKHPPAHPIHPDALLDFEPEPSHPVIFENLCGDSMRHVALHCQGAAGPSGMDAAGWRRMCTMYHGASKRLCNALAVAAKRICTSYTDPEILRPFIACRLILLSKNPGVRPIGICDTLRRIMGKAILKVLGPEIQTVAGSAQLCARQPSGCEAAVHAIEDIMSDPSVEGVLMVDAWNAFNSLNRAVMLRNLQVLCPSLAVPAINFYRSNAELFVGEETILSQEGTTQGDPLSMAIYALSTLPLISKIGQENLTQTWFADDACGGASIQALHKWWTELSEEGPKFGYHVNPPKTWLLAKEEHLQKAKALFDSCGINITTEGRPLLGAPIGSQFFSDDFIKEQISQWVAEFKALSSVAKTQPQAAYAAYTHGLAGKWAYLLRACEISSEQFSSLEEMIRLDFISAISGRAVSDIERVLLTLPARMGGLRLPNPASDADVSYLWSRNVTKALVDRILHRRDRPMAEVVEVQRDAFKANQRSKAWRLDELSSVTKEQLPPRMKRAVIAAEEKGSSSWLTALPLADFGFSLSKGEFQDALNLRYGWTPPRLPSLCVCGDSFNSDHALSCTHGGYLGLRHNEVRDLLGELLDQTCSNVCLEPVLKPIDGEQLHRSTNTTDDARLDIKAGGFWSANRNECAYFDVRVFYPHGRSHRHRTLDGTTLPIARAGQTPWLWRSCSKRGEGHLHTFGVLCHWRYLPRGYDVSQAAGWQGGWEEEQQLCTDRGLALVPPVFRTPLSKPAVPERIQTTEGVRQGRPSTAGSRHGWGLRVVS